MFFATAQQEDTLHPSTYTTQRKVRKRTLPGKQFSRADIVVHPKEQYVPWLAPTNRPERANAYLIVIVRPRKHVNRIKLANDIRLEPEETIYPSLWGRCAYEEES